MSQFQTRVKNFFWQHYRHLDWYEEVPLVGAALTRLRWDFLCAFLNKKGETEIVFIECQGDQHLKQNPKFHKTIESFDDQILRDLLKLQFADINSNFAVIEIFEEDEPITLEWFEKVYPNILPKLA